MRLTAWCDWPDADLVLRGWRRVGLDVRSDRVLYARRWWWWPVRLWWWWTVEGGRWTMHRDLIARGLLHGPEGGHFRDFRTHPMLPPP